MSVEREMIRIKRAVTANQGRDSIVNSAGQRPRHVPIHSVMNDQEVHAGGDGFLKGNKACVDCGAYLGDSAVVGDLQAVESAGGVLEGRAPGAFVTIIDQFVE